MKTIFFAKEAKGINNGTKDIVAVADTVEGVKTECKAMYDCGIAPNEVAVWKDNKFYVDSLLICTIKSKKVKDNFDMQSLLSC